VQDTTGPVRTQSVGGSSRRTGLIVLVVTLLVLVAALKPWQGNEKRSPGTDVARPGPSDGRGGARPDLVSPSPEPSLVLLARRQQCQNPAEWRIVTIERSGPVHSRGLLPVTPVAATGPSDSAIQAHPFHAEQLIALGYCLPVVNHPDPLATEARVTIWRRSPAGPAAALRNLPVLDPALAGIGEVYLAPAPALHATTWPDGTYVFEVPGAMADGKAGWFALDFSANATIGLQLSEP
jgi:hypothetical protein